MALAGDDAQSTDPQSTIHCADRISVLRKRDKFPMDELPGASGEGSAFRLTKPSGREKFNRWPSPPIRGGRKTALQRCVIVSSKQQRVS
jgi:hypothetical protein